MPQRPLKLELLAVHMHLHHVFRYTFENHLTKVFLIVPKKYGFQTILILSPYIYNRSAEIQDGANATRAIVRIPKLFRQ